MGQEDKLWVINYTVHTGPTNSQSPVSLGKLSTALIMQPYTVDTDFQTACVD